ncbi:uncharacterized protein CDV56_109136 [Aspergillus thermomutatus]|uniref:Uncharacterized protein n=1 Tax=Aspergillus thermomutatus TaxID=41047 RepID=A0A397HND1_ASPTH|nr:uncharacterized protein CDV56_109136 [Aspergillus thermomutatus]RHZ63468.1 hypothetical protein CDV56_109136 [Aspergillus thermomutatus]
MTKKLTPEDYRLAWICPLGVEQTTALKMLDNVHQPLDLQPTLDQNVYTLGDIAGHNVIVTGLASPGNIPTVRTVSWMKMTFPNLSFGLVVGIGGGVPRMTDAGMIRLGDIVVSKPTDQYPGVVQYGHGKQERDYFKPTGALPPPPPLVNKAQIETENDDGYVTIHRGTIASGDVVVKDALTRDQLAGKFGAYCFETEAAGALAELGCIVIRGISDYCDSHKNNKWHGYAAATAAAYAREIFFNMPTYEVTRCGHSENGNHQISQEIATWLSPADYGLQQRYLKDSVQDGGDSFLSCSEMREWVNQPKRTLHFSGNPGVGKSTTMSTVIHHLQAQFADDPQVGLAFVYCGYERQWESRSLHLLLNLLKQLVAKHDHVPENVKRLYQSRKCSGITPAYSEVFQLLSAVVAEYVRIFIIIDGLEESDLSESDQHRFLKTLFSLQAGADVNILITGHLDWQIENIPDSVLSVDIHCADDAIEGYFDKNRSKLPSPVRDDTSLQQHIKSTMIQVAGGQFLMAYLYMKFLCKATSSNIVQDQSDITAWRTLRYDHAYEMIFKPSRQKRKTISDVVFRWLTYARSPLHLEDLVFMLPIYGKNPQSLKGLNALLYMSTSKDFERFNLCSLVDPNRVISSCGGLVKVDAERKIVDFIHATTRAYFVQNRLRLFPDGEDKVASICAKYISWYISIPKNVSTRRFNNNLLSYATQYWGYHVVRSASDGGESILSLLEDENAVLEFGRAIVSSGEYPERRQATTTGITKFHLAAYFGMVVIMEVLLQKLGPIRRSWFSSSPLDTRDAFGRTPLSFAAEKGHSKIVGMLLEKGAHVEGQDSNGRTPLTWAARGGHIEVVEQLLAKGAYIHSQDRAGRSPLSWAAAHGHQEVVKHLLAQGAVLELLKELPAKGFFASLKWIFQPKAHQDVVDETMSSAPLIRASCNGYLPVMEMLIEAGAHPDEKDREGRTALSWAAGNGHAAAVQWLLLKNAQVEVADKNERTALWWASLNGHYAIVRALLREGASLETKDKDGATAVLLAAANGQKAIVQLLSENGADLKIRNKDGMTALLHASANGHRATVQWLLSTNSIHLEDTDRNGQTALSWAVRNGSLSMVQFLLLQGASLARKDKEGRNALSWAAGNGHREIVQHLLPKVTDTLLKERDTEGQTSLIKAAQNGHADIVRLFLERCTVALLESQDKTGMTALSWACKNGHEAAAKEILASGMTNILEIKNQAGQTPLILAAGHGHEALVQLLLRNTTAIEARDHSGSTALSKAAAAGSCNVVQLLLTHGARINSRSANGRTPLMLTVSNGHHKAAQIPLGSGAKIDAKDNIGQTSLFMAVKNNDREMVKLLLGGGAAVEIVDSRGGSPMSLAENLGKKGEKLRQVPEGWATDYGFMSYFIKGEWAKITKRCGLRNPVAIMCTTPDSGEHYGLISAGGRYYFTDDIAWSILEIVKLTTLDEILKRIFDDREKSIKSFETKVLEEVETREDLEEEKEKQEADIALMEQMKAALGFMNWNAMESD